MYDYDPSVELYHHGIKGQKWGVRRYQNSDGSLTDEGRRRYGFGKGANRLITKNTASRMKGGTALGAKIGAGLGVGLTAAVLGTTAAAGLPLSPATAVAAGAAYISTYTAGGAFTGLKWGTIVGAVETQIGRDYIKQYDEGLADFEMRDLNHKKPVNHGTNVSIVR